MFIIGARQAALRGAGRQRLRSRSALPVASGAAARLSTRKRHCDVSCRQSGKQSAVAATHLCQHLPGARVALVVHHRPGIPQGALEHPKPILQIRQCSFRDHDRVWPGLRPRAGGPCSVRPLAAAPSAELPATAGDPQDNRRKTHGHTTGSSLASSLPRRLRLLPGLFRHSDESTGTAAARATRRPDSA